jgi:hypothetical protein
VMGLQGCGWDGDCGGNDARNAPSDEIAKVTTVQRFGSATRRTSALPPTQNLGPLAKRALRGTTRMRRGGASADSS